MLVARMYVVPLVQLMDKPNECSYDIILKVYSLNLPPISGIITDLRLHINFMSVKVL